MGDPTRGLYKKFVVTRTDHEDEPGEKHYQCDYFVLDLTHDPNAHAALTAYADACESEYPILARDLRQIVSGESPEAEAADRPREVCPSCGSPITIGNPKTSTCFQCNRGRCRNCDTGSGTVCGRCEEDNDGKTQP